VCAKDLEQTKNKGFANNKPRVQMANWLPAWKEGGFVACYAPLLFLWYFLGSFYSRWYF